MKVAVFCHSIRSDWNHGNAHFLRGIVSDMASRGMEVVVYEPENSWSAENLAKDKGPGSLEEYRDFYPGLEPRLYDPSLICGDVLDQELRDADLVLVHEWNDPELVRAIGEHRKEKGSYRLLFHDTHHRSVTDPDAMAAYDLSSYDGVLAFGDVIRGIYLNNGWARDAWTWHEAADPRVFRPLPEREKTGDLVWIGNWGDDEREAELKEFLIEPVQELGLRAKVYGVRYPDAAIEALRRAGIQYMGSLPNYLAPEVFAQHRMTIHVPRRPYAEALPGIPTIRMFEALACGIPLISAPWQDEEHLFTPGDYLNARDGREMREAMSRILSHPGDATEMARRGRRTILQRHTCMHRVNELLDIVHRFDSRDQVGAA